MSTEFSHNPAHEIGTCARCGEEMVYNVPRLGPVGGFVHKSDGQYLCGGRKADLIPMVYDKDKQKWFPV